MDPNYGSFAGWNSALLLSLQQQQYDSQVQLLATQIQKLQQAAQQQQQAAILALEYDLQLAAAAQQIRQAIQAQQAAQLQQTAKVQPPQQAVQPTPPSEGSGLPQSHLDSLLLACEIAQQEQQLFDKLSVSENPSGALSEHKQQRAQELELQQLLQQTQHQQAQATKSSQTAPPSPLNAAAAQQEQAAQTKTSQQHIPPQKRLRQQQQYATPVASSASEEKKYIQTSSIKKLPAAHALLSFPPRIEYVNPPLTLATSSNDSIKEGKKTDDQTEKNLRAMITHYQTRKMPKYHNSEASTKSKRASESKKALPEMKNTISQPSSVVSHVVPSQSAEANPRPVTPISSGKKVDLHYGKGGSGSFPLGLGDDRNGSLLHSRKRLWSTLLDRRPVNKDSNALSDWLLDVLAVSDLSRPLKGEVTTAEASGVSSVFFSSDGIRKRQKLASPKNDSMCPVPRMETQN